MDTINVTFPGGKKVDAHFGGFTVHTDQGKDYGGEGSAPEPFDLFFTSIATCVGIYVLEFCNKRGIGTEGLGVSLSAERNAQKKLYDKVCIGLTLPEDFPEKHKKSILRTADLCTVKKHIMNPPEFVIGLE